MKINDDSLGKEHKNLARVDTLQHLKHQTNIYAKNKALQSMQRKYIHIIDSRILNTKGAVQTWLRNERKEGKIIKFNYWMRFFVASRIIKGEVGVISRSGIRSRILLYIESRK